MGDIFSTALHIFGFGLIGLALGIPAVLMTVNASKRTKRKRYINSRRNIWGDAVVDSVLRKKVEIGMTGEMVTYAWGKPDSTHTRNTESVKESRWLYGKPDKPGAKIIFFENAYVSNIQRIVQSKTGNIEDWL